ncbi:Putative Probable molybdenum cofactor guanylyltransferase [Clostridium chauvoei JF4335]|nr:Putative Probable molybdenum cofactor guanylyltransferase [Clostridium chauvoei JF4335]
MNYNNKAFLKFREKTFIENIIESGKDFKEIIIVANNKEVYKNFNVRVIEDIYKEKGPLGGIHSALKNSKTKYCLCVACDMPLLSRELLKKLGSIEGDYEVLIPKINDKLQPLCAIYSKNIVNSLEENLKKDENKLQSIILGLNYKIIEGLLEKEFSNINTPEEYRTLEEK